MLEINWVQHPAGHGGFHTGTLDMPGQGSFSWAFDCGSRSTAQFNAYLRTWSRRSPLALDWLFISHFDTDHVSGLDMLMSRIVVQNVMVPYLNESEFAYLLLREIARDNLGRTLFDLAADPVQFFVSRGADRVIFLGGRRPGDEPGFTEARDPDRRKDDRGWYTVISPPPTSLQASEMAASDTSQSPPQAQIIDGGYCDIILHARNVGLHLKPYRAPVQPHAARGIIQAIQSLVGGRSDVHLRPGLGALAYAVARHARTPAGRAGLKAIYKHYVGSSNRASLSLLSVPIVSADTKHHWCVYRPFRWTSGVASVPAWLNTGDAELLAPSDLGDWQRCYASALAQVRVLAVPHHGSDKNSDAALQALCPDATLVAHVRSESNKHPGDVLTIAAGDRLVTVTEDAGSTVKMTLNAY